jgi:hypothetical protein
MSIYDALEVERTGKIGMLRPYNTVFRDTDYHYDGILY